MREFFNLFILLSLQFSTSTHSTQQPPPSLTLSRLVRGLQAWTNRLLLCLILLLTLSFLRRRRKVEVKHLQNTCKRHEESGSCYFNHLNWGEGSGHPVTAEGFGPQWWSCGCVIKEKNRKQVWWGRWLCLFRTKLLARKNKPEGPPH